MDRACLQGICDVFIDPISIRAESINLSFPFESKVRLVLGFQSNLILCWDVRHLTRVGCTMCSVG